MWLHDGAVVLARQLAEATGEWVMVVDRETDKVAEFNRPDEVPAFIRR